MLLFSRLSFCSFVLSYFGLKKSRLQLTNLSDFKLIYVHTSQSMKYSYTACILVSIMLSDTHNYSLDCTDLASFVCPLPCLSDHDTTLFVIDFFFINNNKRCRTLLIQTISISCSSWRRIISHCYKRSQFSFNRSLLRHKMHSCNSLSKINCLATKT